MDVQVARVHRQAEFSHSCGGGELVVVVTTILILDLEIPSWERLLSWNE
jgi:hypothetical protein